MEQQQEQQRIDALHSLGVLDTGPEPRFDRIVRLAQRVFDVPIVAVNLIDSDRQWTKAAVGMSNGDEMPREDSFCAVAIQDADTFTVRDTLEDANWIDNPLVTADPHLRFYAGAPVAAPGGQRVGTLCLASDEPRELSDQESRMLRDLADWVERELAADADSEQALEVLRRLRPRRTPDLEEYDVAGAFLPTQKVGGDFYDWHDADGAVQIVLADVMGKGLAAAVTAAGLRTALRVTSRFNPLDVAVHKTSTSLEEDFSDSATFTTMFVGQLHPEDGRIEYVDAGHGLALIIPVEGPVRHLLSQDPPLGAVPGHIYTVQEARLDPGDTLLVVSDGILDVFPDVEAAIAAARELMLDQQASAQALVDQIMAVNDTQRLEDDLTAVVVRRRPTA